MRKIIKLFLWIYFISGISGFFQIEAGNQKDEDEVFKNLADSLSKSEKKLPNKTIAVYGFEVIGRPGDSYAVFATEKLTHFLVSNGSLLVVERSRIDQVLKEQSLSMTGAIDANTASKIGQILAVDAVIIGTIHVTDDEAEFIVRVIQSEKGIILASANKKLKIGSNIVKTDNTSGSAKTTNVKSVTKSSTDNKTVKLESEKNVYSQSEEITISYSGMPGNDSDWLTLIAESQPENTYGEWFYTSGKKSGQYSFKGVEPGDYEVRVYFDWPSGGYRVQKRLKIKVK